MNTQTPLYSTRYCGRTFTVDEINRIRNIIAEDSTRNRNQISCIVCREFRWYKRDGGLKDMSCRVALLRMHRDGHIVLPPPRGKNGNSSTRITITSATDPPTASLACAAGCINKYLTISPVTKQRESRLWNEYIERYHYLGYSRLPGAQARFLVQYHDQVIACLGFGAAAWCVADRDTYIGWNTTQRQRNLHLVINNARFLILPWVTLRNLASMILGAIAKMLPDIWEKRYGYRPALLETFVESGRFRGTCYKAANWRYVGKTKGRGKLDTNHKHDVPIKDIFLYPLHKGFRDTLTEG